MILIHGTAPDWALGVVDSNGVQDAYVLDRLAGTAKLASPMEGNPTFAKGIWSLAARDISGDGTLAVISAADEDFVSDDFNRSFDVFALDCAPVGTRGIPGLNDYTINGQGSGTRSCTALAFDSPVFLDFEVTTLPSSQVFLLFRSAPCQISASVFPPCGETTPDIPLRLGMMNIPGGSDVTGLFDPVPVFIDALPFDISVSTQALVLHPCGNLFTQAYDVTLRAPLAD